METDPAADLITSEAGLAEIYGEASQASRVKELDHISDDYRAFIEASPFVVLATAGPEGLDTSPRGDPAPVAHVIDRHTLALPDRRGNNRIDSLRNIVRDPRVALIFLIPGIGETIRVNGRARISVAPDLLERHAMQGKPPRSVILVTAERVYFQCQKALARSRLWAADSQLARDALPSTGSMLGRMSTGGIDGAAYDAEYPERLRQTIY
ncbi:pyridoxamine 5'-phosphate oxidase family protein [Paralimibaculum aggregatum]|uniref:Pyridoxamine 5'-phosphate oxidase family protein n=1 Tax=Paralimibaculum aggregatum TaxID=3036245 RepID=A0ABQ6LKZ7_9RHOB|nr:pyridoxamine 5'-phosphate oxidase family protein [Limibaculum sp. NKW23]GMG82925.1 pyridoxamine 5'-phosphate oxidase family protein [Limibaculum sp. NKW23]